MTGLLRGCRLSDIAKLYHTVLPSQEEAYDGSSMLPPAKPERPFRRPHREPIGLYYVFGRLGHPDLAHRLAETLRMPFGAREAIGEARSGPGHLAPLAAHRFASVTFFLSLPWMPEPKHREPCWPQSSQVCVRLPVRRVPSTARIWPPDSSY